MALLGDDRGQAIQIGAVLLFGIVIIGLSIHQAAVVPGQNRQVEFNHFSGAQDDLENLRNSLIKAGQTGTAVPVGVKLGTAYPPRLIAFQPQSSTGRLYTGSIGGSGTAIELRNTDANMSAICGLDSVSTRHATYRPSYTYLDSVDNVTYENTVVYTNGRPTGRFVQTEQQVVANDSIHVYPLLAQYSRGGQSLTSLTLRGGKTGVNTSVPGPFSLVIPTRLSVANWQELLSDQPQVTGVSQAGQDAVEITFAGNASYAIRCSPVGVGTTPDNTPTVDDGASDGDGEGAEENVSINPNFGTDVVLRDVHETGSNSSLNANQVRLELENTHPNAYQNITRLRFPFFAAAGQGAAGAALPGSFEYRSTVVPRLGPFQSIARRDIPPGSRTNVTLSFYCGDSGAGSGSYDLAQGDFFIFDALFENGRDRTYFVALDDSGQSGQGGRCGGGNQGGGNQGSGGSGPPGG